MALSRRQRGSLGDGVCVCPRTADSPGSVVGGLVSGRPHHVRPWVLLLPAAWQVAQPSGRGGREGEEEGGINVNYSNTSFNDAHTQVTK